MSCPGSSPGQSTHDRQWSLGSQSPGATLASQGFVYLDDQALRSLAGVLPTSTERWSTTWNDLPADRYLKDGGRYRSRRHSCFVQDIGAGHLQQVAHRAHWQSTDYNALHGGIDRMFEPMSAALTADPDWHRLLSALGELFAADRAIAAGRDVGNRDASQWSIEAHQFRIDTRDGMGRPTPEGAHRDGVDYVAVVLVDRVGIKGGETRLFEAEGPHGMRFVMTQPWSAVLLNDRRMIHEATPIQPELATPGPKPDSSTVANATSLTEGGGYRDTLVLTYRADGFQQRG